MILLNNVIVYKYLLFGITKFYQQSRDRKSMIPFVYHLIEPCKTENLTPAADRTLLHQ